MSESKFSFLLVVLCQVDPFILPPAAVEGSGLQALELQGKARPDFLKASLGPSSFLRKHVPAQKFYLSRILAYNVPIMAYGIPVMAHKEVITLAMKCGDSSSCKLRILRGKHARQNKNGQIRNPN